MALLMTPMTTRTPPPEPAAAAKTSNLAMKPLVSGMPAKESRYTENMAPTSG